MQSHMERYEGFFKSLNKDDLIAEIKQEFALKNTSEFDSIYPFSNDCNYSQTIKILKRFEATKNPKNTVSIVFGESNIISLLPALSYISNIVLLADVNKTFHAHLNFLLDCFKKSNTIQEFKDNYLVNSNPVFGIWQPQFRYNFIYDNDRLNACLDHSEESVGKYYFLTNQDTYDQCKTALKKMTLLPIHFNVGSQNSCYRLNKILHQYHANLNFCNLTNIGEYSRGLKGNVEILLKGFENALILFSTRGNKKKYTEFPGAVLNIGLKDYLAIDTKKPFVKFDEFVEHMLHVNERLNHMQINDQLTLKAPIIKAQHCHEKCYSILFCCNEIDMRNIIDGKLYLNLFKISPALGDENLLIEILKKLHGEEMDKQSQNNENYIDITDNLKKSWIITFFNNKEKVNRYLPYDAQFYTSDKEKIDYHLKISSYIFSAKKINGDFKIEKNVDCIPVKYKQHNDQINDFAKSSHIIFNEKNNPVVLNEEVLDQALSQDSCRITGS